MNDREEIKVESGVPMPRHPNTIWPFAKMQVGDSFAFMAADRHRVQSAAAMRKSRNNEKYSIRQFENAYRCWRVE